MTSRGGLRVVVISAVQFGIRVMPAVSEAGGRIVGVVALDPSRAPTLGDYADVAAWAAERGIDAIRTVDANEMQSRAAIAAWQPDVIFVLGWPRLIGPELRALAPLGCIGTHPTMLPEHRGRHPLIWALVEGRTRGGLTLFHLDDGPDSGDIVWQREFSIGPDDDAGVLYERVSELGVIAIRDIVPQLMNGTAPRVPQDHSLATYRGRRTMEDGEIDWSSSTKAIHDLIRALAPPYPGAHTFQGADRVVIRRARPVAAAFDHPGLDAPPGTVVAPSHGGWLLRTGDGLIEVCEAEPALHVGGLLGRRA